jgi:hypothetical protein
MIERAITYGEVERVAFAKPELFVQGSSLQPAKPAPLFKTNYRLACWIYLTASAVATLGWLLFLARMALRLVQIAWGLLENI